MTSAVVLIIAALLDYLIGDPWGWPHPVQFMGWVISRLTKFFLQLCQHSLTQRLAGILLGTLVIIGSGFVGFFLIQTAKWLHPLLGIASESILLASCFASRSLRTAAIAVLQPLTAGDLEQARQILSNYVGRDTQNLSEAEILRAILETVTENATDGVMAPLFYAIIGVFIPFVGSIPLALAYKASSTLDSMVGYREAPYTYLGWFSARLEDCLTWLPCRLTVITLALLSGRPMHVWRICSRDAIKDPSPNSGWSECAYAAILGVQMGGKNWYRGVAKQKPLLGDAIYPITPTSIYNALQLTRYCFLLWLGIAIAIILIRAWGIGHRA
ncbi:cobalamin biosynthesis protein CobD [Nostoc linckia z18]|jgi:adenosylcobinamide-phosphate synthase|uniref:Cobalamin biosynthesis protein CobD n=2 Tax=Nostoc linckia TaxID=92942 RepID=A0A9Q6EJ79_NOSLI|nr:adenosylcobinamide-phosphate synthase CbiB [Nostoc linckia]PHK42093.1 cobalamin biosynthesis protein CobD [Nostoc linckia z15]PHK46516.1 cobalamin biosynthesis protein CobD [Nostoc linckia z16]PHJ66281.1 cobalamin biosynthesis protein CobD [Nostoc linckia z1]PHJ71648.1 cobalamin biosynthesis protein CobD [Nostoc linckia z3]PHJ77723.1 cobalamin biosynthesis protein CobD [Nostoc linckia z2]